jgi:cyanate lyase
MTPPEGQGRMPLSTRSMLIIGLGLAFLHLVGVGLAFGWQQTAQSIRSQAADMRSNIAGARQAQATRSESLSVAIELAEDRLAELQATIDLQTGGYDLYPRVYAITQVRGGNLQAVFHEGEQLLETADGELRIVTYRVEVSAEPSICLDILSQIEAEGGSSLAVDDIRIEPDSLVCHFRIGFALAPPPALAGPGQ